MRSEAKIQKPTIMGILNLTPDSFSDGGLYLEASAAYEQAQFMIENGASIIDVGAESTRPYASPVSEDLEWERIFPFLKLAAKKGLKADISIDSMKPEIMERALDYGASIWNNVNALSCQTLPLKILQNKGLKKYIAMHMYKEPKSMQKKPLNAKEAVSAVEDFFCEVVKHWQEEGFALDKLYLDPGIGFGKSISGNMALMAKIPTWQKEYKLCLGISRKSWLAKTFPDLGSPKEYDDVSKVAEFYLWLMGAKMIRTHNVEKLSSVFSRIAEEDLGVF